MKKVTLLNTIPFYELDIDSLLSYIISSAIKRDMKKHIHYLNAYGIVTYFANTLYARAIDSADITYADGWGPIIAARITGGGPRHRINVGDYIHSLLKKAQEARLRIYILGYSEEVIQRTMQYIAVTYPGITLCGFHNGFFPSFQEKNLVLAIRRSKPNILLIGMGSPKQELFAYNNRNALPQCVTICVGGVFNYVSGSLRRAPLWMQKAGLEWLFRLFQEPRRLWKRYTFDILRFGCIVLTFLTKRALKADGHIK